MTRDPRYDILFEPVRIGPVTARNRFYQVPHCTGIGWTQPETLARLRGIKAEGGWAVVSTEETEIHPSADCEPFHEGRLWDDRDIPAMAMMADAVHEHGALAAIEIMHHGASVANWGTRLAPMGPSHRPIIYNYPVQARAMDKQDIRDLRQWHRDAALRSKQAGFDIVYVYATHDLSIAQQFLQRSKNDRTDEYGGSLENRARLFRELIEDTKDAVGDRCAVAVRFCADELVGDTGLTCDGEARDVIEMLAELPDLWDINISNWPNDSQTSRFAKEGFQEQYTSFVKQLTTKPVVGVGRFTSPDTMVSQVRRGIVDFIGAARPSIADPFLPKKIEEGRIDEIRECIGCNMCVSSDYTSTNLRCTQNPTMGEEWRRGWHPEIIPPKKSEGTVLVVGAGPAGLEAALSAARRGFEVHLAEATDDLGGRVARESKLPGLSEWARVRDWRVTQLERMANVSIYRGGALEADHVLEFGARHVAIATGSVWRGDGIGRNSGTALPGFDSASVFTPDDLMSGRVPTEGPVIIWDDDHYYMGGVLAELCRAKGLEVTIVTPAAIVSSWTVNTLEAMPIARRIAGLGIEVVNYTNLAAFGGGKARLVSQLTGEVTERSAGSLVTLTARLPADALYEQLRDRWQRTGIASLTRIGDCWAPSTIQQAVYTGHKWARGLDEPAELLIPRELPMIESGPGASDMMKVAAFAALVLAAGQADGRARELGIPFEGKPGPINAITDVRGVEVGQVTLIAGDGALKVGVGPVRTGVTAIFPRGRADSRPVYGGFFDLNGNGEMTGRSYLEDFGIVQGQIGLSDTNAVGQVYAGIQQWSVKHFGVATWPVVAETWSGYLSDLDGFHVTAATAIAALDAAKAGPVEEGNVGGGTGMVCFGFKGGMGTASRVVSVGDKAYTVGVLVQCNTGDRKVLRIAGAPVGQALAKRWLPCFDPKLAAKAEELPACTLGGSKGVPPPDQGSIIIVVGTDAPLMPKQLDRVAKRAAMGLARLGSYSGNSSGDLIVSFSTAVAEVNHEEQDKPDPIAPLPNAAINPIFEGTVQATEEAIVNALVAARTMTGINGARYFGLPHDELCEILKRYNRLESPVK